MATFELPPLPYAQDALTPHMSAETFQFHHGKHHATYVKNLNDALAKSGSPETSLEAIIKKSKAEGDKFVFNQSAQIWNHTFFWNSMTPNKGAIGGDLAKAINDSFGGVDQFKAAFTDKAVKHFASGWAWLVADKSGKLSVIDSHDADTPIANDAGTPLLTCDVWEHAYYIDRRNDRGAYVKAFLEELANWDFAAAQLAAARGDGAGFVHPKAT
jgi:Fe-Mn family superoxide dismutase